MLYAVGRWFLEAVGLGQAQIVDPWELARRWQFQICPRPTARSSGVVARRPEVIWIDLRDDEEEQRRVLARELASAALEIAGVEDEDPDLLAEVLLHPQTYVLHTGQ